MASAPRAPGGGPLRGDALTIGFARRFATYKRATLLLRDLPRLKALLLDEERPVQLIVAGKAHPADGAGKDFIRELLDTVRAEGLGDHVVFIEDYDLRKAAYLVQGADVWLNTPRRPYEASGTSGMKVLRQRRPQLLGAGRLVGRGLSARRGLGHRRRAGVRPRRVPGRGRFRVALLAAWSAR